MILEPAIRRARGGRIGALWQGAVARRAPARQAEQRRQRPIALRHRVRSAFTQKMMRLVCEILSIR